MAMVIMSSIRDGGVDGVLDCDDEHMDDRYFMIHGRWCSLE